MTQSCINCKKELKNNNIIKVERIGGNYWLYHLSCFEEMAGPENVPPTGVINVDIDSNGNKRWYLDGKLHREDGPAVEFALGEKQWWINGLWHREDGPAIEWSDGTKEWYLNGKRHREDGPAAECVSGEKFWYLNDKPLTKQEFNKCTK